MMTGFDVLFALPPGEYFEAKTLGQEPELFLHDCLKSLVQSVRVRIVSAPPNAHPTDIITGRRALITQVPITTEKFWRCLAQLEPKSPNAHALPITVLRYEIYWRDYCPVEGEIVAVLDDPPDRYRSPE